MTVDGTSVRRYNEIERTNISSRWLAALVLIVALAVGGGTAGRAIAQTPTSERKEGIPSEQILTARDVLDIMLDSQSNLRGYKADASVEVVTQRIRVPKVPVKVVVRRPAEVTIEYLWAKLKPRYPLFPDPEMFSEGMYSVDINRDSDDRYYWLTARPLAGAASPYDVDLWVERSSGLLKKARLSLPNGESTTLTAEYTKIGPKCWVPEKVYGEGAMLIRDILPLAPVSLALKLSGKPEAVRFTAVFSNISLLR